MKDQLQTIQTGLAIAIDAEGFVDKPVRRALLDAVKAANQLEAMAGEPVAKVVLTETLGLPCLQWLDLTRQFDFKGGEFLYATPPAQPQYEAGDMASAHNDGFRAGVASVAQQPQEPDWKHPKIQALISSDARNRIVIGLIWQILKNPDGDFSAMDMEYWDSIHDAVREAVIDAQQPQAEAVPLTHVLVPMEPTDEMIDAACKAVDDLYRVDFVRAYSAAIAHLKAGYRDESYWRGWNAAIKALAAPQQAEAVQIYDAATHAAAIAVFMTRMDAEQPDADDKGVSGWLQEAEERIKSRASKPLSELLVAPQQVEAVRSKPVRVCHIKDVACAGAAVKCGECPEATPQQAEAVPSDVVRDAERWRTFLATRPANTHAVINQAIDDAATRKGGGV